MDEEHEEFFDSLDEQPRSEDTFNKSCSTTDTETITPLASKNPGPVTDNVGPSKMSKSKIPKYVGHYQKKLTLKLGPNKQHTQPYNSSSAISATSAKCKGSHALLPKEKPQKTYLGIFYAQRGIKPDNCTRSITDSARAVCGEATSRTLHSFKSCSSLNAPEWDTASMYDKYLVKLYPNNGDPIHSSTRTTYTEVDLDNLVSVSQACMVHKKQKGTKEKLKGLNLCVLRGPTLGSLGPDLESSKLKMEKFRKQQEYGKQASIRNRVKIMQNQAKTI